MNIEADLLDSLNRVSWILEDAVDNDPNHSTKRAQQRGVSDNMIDICVGLGVKERSFKAITYTITDRCLSKTGFSKYVQDLRGLRVVGRMKEGILHIRTVYWYDRVSKRKPRLRK